MLLRIALLMVFFVSGCVPLFASEPGAPSEVAQLPNGWRAGWDRPTASDRPLQIVHGIQLNPALSLDDQKATITSRIKALEERGLGGVVCNVPFTNYLQSEPYWHMLVTAIEVCRDLGMVVWIYDEQGYPSGAAGGLVLKENPAYEAIELAYDATRDVPLFIRPSYEFTHANNNYYASRRYANLLDADAVQCFIAKTHDAYWERLGPFFGNTIQAVFTDEPSLLAMSLGQIPENARKRVPVIDPPDPTIKPFPAVPWCRDMLDRYRERFGEDLSSQRHRLFVGDTAKDRRVRRQFWSLVADLVTLRYFAALGSWSADHHVASSGHTLSEESILNHVPLEGNGLKVLSQMQIPGMDMLSSDPQVVIHSGWLTAGMPSSAAALTGRRRVMTEVSDFSQKMGGAGPAALIDMQATAAWQAAWGVTDFTLYYGTADRPIDQCRAYSDFVGRMNAILKPARRDPDVLLYYPIYDLWEEYRPVADRLTLAAQSARAKQIVSSFMRLGRLLQRSQVPFVLIDFENLAKAQVIPGRLVVGTQGYRSLILPDGVQLPEEGSDVLERTRASETPAVILNDSNDEPLTWPALRESLQPAYRIEPTSPRITLGRFRRDDRQVLLLVNVGSEAYDGLIVSAEKKSWLELNPANGSIQRMPADLEGRACLSLGPRETRLLIERP